LSGFALGKDLDEFRGPLRSPDKTLEAYSLPEGTSKDVHGVAFPYGIKLFVRQTGSGKPSVLVEENARWMAAQWAPHSNLLAVENHTDGHACRVDVYEFVLKGSPPSLECAAVFHSPDDDYDVKWYIEGWDPTRRVIRLRKDELYHPQDPSGQKDFSSNLGFTSIQKSFRIGTKPLR
jgi:hypothetical protein